MTWEEREKERRERLWKRNRIRAAKLADAALTYYHGKEAEDRYYKLLLSTRTTKDVLEIAMGMLVAEIKALRSGQG